MPATANAKRRKTRPRERTLFDGDPEFYQVSPRVCLQAGDFFRVSGGPEYRGAKYGPRGKVFCFLRICRRKGTRVWIDAQEVERGQLGGTHTLFVEGRGYRHRQLPGVMMRPYRIRKLTPKAIRKLFAKHSQPVKARPR